MIKNTILFITALGLFHSCEVYKKATTRDRSSTNTVREVTEVFRKADTVTIEVPNVIYKDTVITKTSYDNKTIARITYDDRGASTFDCIPAEISERLERIEIAQQNNITNNTEKDREFKPQHLFYGMGFFLLIILLLIGVVIYFINKTQKALPQTLIEVFKQLK